MVNLDGSTGEGGGQMLRTALVWSLLTGQPFRMNNIRAGRKEPGLKAQHVRVLEALRLLGPVAFQGAVEGSSGVTFSPAPLRGTSARVDIGTAGSITLLLQTVLPAALLAAGESRLEIVGGTDVRWSPPADYLSEILLPVAARYADRLIVDVVRRGFYPRGGGRVILETSGWRPASPLELTERGRLLGIRISSVAARGLADRRVAERQSEAAAGHLKSLVGDCEARVAYNETNSLGSVVTCVAQFEGGARLAGCALGERGKPAEEVGREAAERLAGEVASGAAVDEYGGDQLLIWLALAGGALRVSRLSEHARTHLWVTEQFLGPVFQIEGNVIRCSKSCAPH